MDSILNLKVDHRGFVSEYDRDAFFRQQFKLPENTKCFDCGFNNPKWTSVSFSIYLCLNCSGRHRQMGSHISFVRSVDMDRFTRDQLIRLYLGGNGEFASYLYTENLLQRPLNYTNKKILSYTSRLDSLLCKYVDKNSPKSESKEDNKPLQSDNKESENLTNKTEQQLQSQPSVVTDNLESSKNTESSVSTMRDDAEKMNKLRSDAFSDLMDLISIGSQDTKSKVSTNVNTTQPSQLSQPSLESTVAQVKNDILDVFEKFDSVPQSENNKYKFDSVPEFVSMPGDKFEKTNTSDSMLKLDLSNTSLPSVTESFTSLKVGSNQYESFKDNKEYKEYRANKEDFKEFKDNEEYKDALEYVKDTKKTGKPKGSRNKFSSKVNNFDFETFEKENTVQFAQQPTSAVPETSSFTGTPEFLLPKVPSSSSLTSNSGLASSLPQNLSSNPSFSSFSSFGPAGGASVPDQYVSQAPPVSSSPILLLGPSGSVSSSAPLNVSSDAYFGVKSPQPGRVGNTAASSYLNPNLNADSGFSTTKPPSLLTKHGVPRNKFQSMPDLSKFEGKKAISSDAFFGVNQTHSSSTACVNPDAHAFSSDQYFGKHRDENQLTIPTIEDQAMQNLNEIKENIVSAINKGGVLLEKAKQWLYTNYY